MKTLYNLLCCLLTFMMILSLLLFIGLSSLEFFLQDVYINNITSINIPTLIFTIIMTIYIMKKYYKFKTHHLFYRN
ncbi:hypothetical protein N452_10910 [Clostridium botulinum A2 117]|nr:hypothetical protein N452_10910 [Clostridium botulinum A2 117]MBN3417921.1 hypothetical protein [Clostridium botulinum]MBN3442608.1 hypothetical protein [Clostridium botulinum]